MIDEYLEPLVPDGAASRGAVVALPVYNVRNADPACEHLLPIPSLEKLRDGVLHNECVGCDGKWRGVDLSVPMPLFWMDHMVGCTAVAAVAIEIRGIGGDPSRIALEVVPFAGPTRRSS